MARDTLIIIDRNYVFRICWFLAEEGDEGAWLGDGKYTQADLDKAKPEDREHILATLTAAKTTDVERDSRGFYWETRKTATAALKEIRVALKSDGGAPWPDWAIKAKASGWTAPKGWKPS